MDTLHLDLDEQARYRIHARGALSSRWLEMLSGDWVIPAGSTAQPGGSILLAAEELYVTCLQAVAARSLSPSKGRAAAL